jgi:signal transduction histidine kinase/CheY-like chemotaxis protein
MAAVFYRACYAAAARRGDSLYTENISLSGYRLKTWCRLVYPLTGSDGESWGFVVADVAAYTLPDWAAVCPVSPPAEVTAPTRHTARHKRRLAEGYPRLLRQMHETYDELLAAQLVHLAVLTADGRGFRYVNSSFAALLGIDASVAPATSPASLFPVETALLDKATLLNEGAMVPDFQTELRTPDGRLMFVRIRLRTVRHMQTRGIGLSLVDLTAQRHNELILVEAQRMEAFGQLTGGIAHDFNNFLSVILLNLDSLQAMTDTDPLAAEMIRDAQMAADHGNELIKRLLASVRRQPLQPTVVHLASLIDDIVGLLSRTLGIRIEVDRPPATPIWPLVIDAAQCRSALTNLAVNARDAMARGGVLRITLRNRDAGDPADQPRNAEPMGDRVVIQVSDSGTGMSPTVMRRALEPFFTTKPKGAGTGLGLSMVQGFIRQSGGHILIDSCTGQGTTFRLLLPRAHVDAEAPIAAAVRPDRAPAGQTILMVEDDPSLLQAAARHLVTLGYRVFTAPNPLVALQVLEQERIDLLFSDVIMPGEMSGLDLAREAARLSPDTRTLLTSGYQGEGEDARADAPCPRHPLLQKPYRHTDLERAVRDVLAEPVR